ncbi:MAG: hypothetical protein LR017_00940 [Candidatus Pacebacteria bacterium]|nr:hypothetical protein [Candidatus Paceibacterota bacterium]
MAQLRTQKLAEEYTTYRNTWTEETGCVLCTCDVAKEFTYWKICPAKFPYDLIASRHDMLLPKRHVTENGLTDAEHAEYLDIKRNHLSDYEFVVEGTSHTQTVPQHFHQHLLVMKKIPE